MSSDQHPTARGVAVVTGGTAGIGRSIVRELANHGWDVGVIARDQGRLDATADDVRDRGRRVATASADVADHEALARAADHITAELGTIDVWVNNAFTGSIAFFDDVKPDEFERITKVTYLGFVNGTRTALSHMVPRNSGTIIQVGSALSYRGIPLQAAYCGAKHAINGFTESVRVELLHKGLDINVCLVQMPGLNTPQFDWVLHRGIDHHPMPVPPVYQPEVAGRAVAYVAEHPRRQMFVGTSTVLTILGNRFLPSLLDWYLARTNVEGQQSPKHDPIGSESNTWEPVPGDDIAAHGAFDDIAHARSPQLWLDMRRGLVAGVAGVAGAAIATLWSRRG